MVEEIGGKLLKENCPACDEVIIRPSQTCSNGHFILRDIITFDILYD